MKTFLLDSFNRYKRFSEELDVKTILCNKSWLIFNDSGDKELYVFQEVINVARLVSSGKQVIYIPHSDFPAVQKGTKVIIIIICFSY